jgi:hypothetical protein
MEGLGGESRAGSCAVSLHLHLHLHLRLHLLLWGPGERGLSLHLHLWGSGCVSGFTCRRYLLMTIVAAVLVVASTGSFLGLLVFEVYRSVRFAAFQDAARSAEEEAVEVRPSVPRRGDCWASWAEVCRSSSPFAHSC